MVYTWMDSPVGRLLLAADDRGLRRLLFADAEPQPGWVPDGDALRPVRDQLAAYFDGKLREFDINLAPEGTPFQLRVWRALLDIPYGQTISYGELARTIGNPAASRAVGLANGSNPISIIVPCHRVIGASGKLTGYGGGLERKSWLLALERQQLPLLPA